MACWLSPKRDNYVIMTRLESGKEDRCHDRYLGGECAGCSHVRGDTDAVQSDKERDVTRRDSAAAPSV